ncbi:MAG: transporter substrate-binding domain-containing protein [Betaproteobacteria bacterium]|nr:transporter substrate-binding domain-containing protein [Betaproteobacteria bacterium]
MRATIFSKQLRALLWCGLVGLWAWAGGVGAQQDETPLDDYRARVEQVKPPRGNALDDILAAGVIKIAVPQDFPPFGSVGAGGKIEGYDIDVANLIAKDLGVKLQLVPVRSGDRLSLLLTKRADVVVASLGVSPERAKAIAFSTPYAPFFSSVFGPANVLVKNLSDLAGKKVAVTRNTLEDLELSGSAPKGAEIIRFPDNDATIQAFLSGQADLIATGNVVAATMAKKHPEKKIESKFIIRESPASIGVRRGEAELLGWVNVFVFHKKLTGDLDRLSRKWLGEPLPALPSL